MAKEIDKFMQDFNKSVSDVFSKYAIKNGVPSVVAVSDLEKLKIDAFDGVKINNFHKRLIANTFRREGLNAGLLAIRNRNSEFRNSHEKATADALKEAGVDKTIFGEKYYSMQTMQIGLKKFAKKVEDGKVLPEQFFKVVTSFAYVIDTYEKSKAGIEYLAKFHEDVIPQIKGVSQLKHDSTAKLKPEYEEAFAKLHVSPDRIASLISGKELPKDISQETESVDKIDFSLKNVPVQNLTTNGMKIASYAANQTYSLIVSELLREKLINNNSMENTFNSLGDSKELIMPLLSINGEENFDQVVKSLNFKEALIAGVIGQLTQKEEFISNLSDEFKQNFAEDATLEEKTAYTREQLINKVLDAAVTTGAFAADNTKDFLYELAKGCAKSEEINAMFSQNQEILDENSADYGKFLPLNSYLYHEGEIYSCGHIDGGAVSQNTFERIVKPNVKRIEENPLTDRNGNLVDNGCSVDLKEASVENLAVNSGNMLVTAFNKLHNDEKRIEKQNEIKDLEIGEAAVSAKQTKTGLYRTLPQYNEYLKMYQGYFSRFNIEIATPGQLIASYNSQQPAQETPQDPPVQ